MASDEVRGLLAIAEKDLAYHRDGNDYVTDEAMLLRGLLAAAVAIAKLLDRGPVNVALPQLERAIRAGVGRKREPDFPQ